jgi:hypothetical protein
LDDSQKILHSYKKKDPNPILRTSSYKKANGFQESPKYKQKFLNKKLSAKKNFESPAKNTSTKRMSSTKKQSTLKKRSRLTMMANPESSGL